MGKKKRKRHGLESDQVAFVSLHGQRFRLASNPNEYIFQKFVSLGAKTTDDPESLRVMFKFLRSCFTPEDWERFDSLCEETSTSGDDILGVIEQALEAWSGRPTRRPSGSSDGPQSTLANSTGDSSLRVMQRQIDKGRPDLALAVHLAQEDQRALKAV